MIFEYLVDKIWSKEMIDDQNKIRSYEGFCSLQSFIRFE